MGSFQSSTVPPVEAVKAVDEAITSHSLTVFSKTTCPYCVRAKQLLREVGAKPFVMELDTRSDGYVIQDELQRRTGSRSVPKVFVREKCIGGCDDTVSLHRQGRLVSMLKEAGAL
ncbi:glutaredoxin-like [Sycon ciliatum]|uniref:glutaredoxin-like n=1 Tax=Sycon ciliatum TaxID=27933 RepID=UPI0031F62153